MSTRQVSLLVYIMPIINLAAPVFSRSSPIADLVISDKPDTTMQPSRSDKLDERSYYIAVGS